MFELSGPFTQIIRGVLRVGSPPIYYGGVTSILGSWDAINVLNTFSIVDSVHLKNMATKNNMLHKYDNKGYSR